MKNLFVRFMNDDSGATAIEYGLIAAGISVAIIAVVNGLGSKVNDRVPERLRQDEYRRLMPRGKAASRRI